MNTVWMWSFWFSLIFVTWTYIGYPLCIYLLAQTRPQEPSVDSNKPTISIIMAVHNGAEILEQKIHNLYALHYPSRKYEIIVVVDGVTDQDSEQICKILKHKPHNTPSISFLLLEEQMGKPYALNRGVNRANGELVLFCDIRQRIELNALTLLTRHFVEPKVGAVSGELVLEGQKGPGMYWRYESAIRQAEGRFDSTVGATGALYIMRRSLYQPIPAESLLDDMIIPLQVTLQGYRVLFDSSAKVYDVEAQWDREFQRKARTLAGNFQLLELMPQLLSPQKNRLLFQFFCHKIMRLLCPYALVMLLISSAALTGSPACKNPFYSYMWWIQFVCYFAVLLASYEPIRRNKFIRLCYTFFILNVAAIVGFARYLNRDFAWTR